MSLFLWRKFSLYSKCLEVDCIVPFRCLRSPHFLLSFRCGAILRVALIIFPSDPLVTFSCCLWWFNLHGLSISPLSYYDLGRLDLPLVSSDGRLSTVVASKWLLGAALFFSSSMIAFGLSCWKILCKDSYTRVRFLSIINWWRMASDSIVMSDSNMSSGSTATLPR